VIATDTPGKPIRIELFSKAIAIMPADGGRLLPKLLPRP
jgi:hypothetical protein